MAPSKKLHFAPTLKLKRTDGWHAGWSQLSQYGMPTFPHCTADEAKLRAKLAGAVAVFHADYRLARTVVLHNGDVA